MKKPPFVQIAEDTKFFLRLKIIFGLVNGLHCLSGVTAAKQPVRKSLAQQKRKTQYQPGAQRLLAKESSTTKHAYEACHLDVAISLHGLSVPDRRMDLESERFKLTS